MKLPIDPENLRKKWFLYVALAIVFGLLVRELNFMAGHLR